MTFAVAHGALYTKSKHWYAFTGTLLLILFWSMFVVSNFIGIVLLIVFIASYAFYAYIIVTKPTTLELNENSFTRDRQSYLWSDFSCRKLEKENLEVTKYHLHLLKASRKDVLSLTIYEENSEVLQDTLSRYLPQKDFRFPVVDQIMRFMKL